MTRAEALPLAFWFTCFAVRCRTARLGLRVPAWLGGAS